MKDLDHLSESEWKEAVGKPEFSPPGEIELVDTIVDENGIAWAILSKPLNWLYGLNSAVVARMGSTLEIAFKVRWADESPIVRADEVAISVLRQIPGFHDQDKYRHQNREIFAIQLPSNDAEVRVN